MKKTNYFKSGVLKLSLVILLMLTGNIHGAYSQAREKISLNNDWLFAQGHAGDPKQDFNYGLALSFSKVAFLQESTMLDKDQRSNLPIPHLEKFNDEKWEKIDIPHDWGMSLGFSIEQYKTKGYRKLGGRSPENSVGWYRKYFALDNSEPDKRYYLEFEGVFRDAQVWVNGIYLGRNESGYTGFSFDITECLNNGKDNVVTVRVDATHSELWSYEGAGIYRNVWLLKTSSVHVPQFGTFVISDIPETGSVADVTAHTEICNTTGEKTNITVESIIKDNKGKTVASENTQLELTAFETASVSPRFKIDDVDRWSLENPALYRLYTRVLKDGKLIDDYETTFGIRSIRFDSQNGFFLNGKRVQIQGVCCHQDHAGVGIAVPDNLNMWRIKKLKEYGVNSYRASHNPPTISILDACDSLGVLVLDEMRVLSSSDEGLQQMEHVIRRDRNHPSVILWCFGNEEPAIQGNYKGEKIAKRMKEIQHHLDPTRLCTAAMNGDWGNGLSKGVDVQGSNYYRIGNLDALHEKRPDLPILLTEEASTVTTRGEYKTDAKKGVHQAYDRDRPGWGATARAWMKYVDERPYIAGAYVWTGFDYGGEAQLFFWPGIASHFGILDYCGFPKDAYWYYKSWWTNEPVIHILPHWNEEGLPLKNDSINVHIYSNMDEVELKLNKRSLGKRKINKFDVAEFKVKYVPGKLEAIGYKNGKKHTTTVETTGRPQAIKLIDETGGEIDKEGRDVGIITVKVTDAKDRVVPTDSSLVHFHIENGFIAGVGNGNPVSRERDYFRRDEMPFRKTFHGLAQVIVRSDGSGKPVIIKATGENLKSDEIQLNIKQN